MALFHLNLLHWPQKEFHLVSWPFPLVPSRATIAPSSKCAQKDRTTPALPIQASVNERAPYPERAQRATAGAPPRATTCVLPRAYDPATREPSPRASNTSTLAADGELRPEMAPPPATGGSRLPFPVKRKMLMRGVRPLGVKVISCCF